MSEFYYKDMECMGIPLPEDILKKKWYGDFEGALRLIDKRLHMDIPNALKIRLELERNILRTLPKDYTLTLEEAFTMVSEKIPDFTLEEFNKLQEEGAIDWIYVYGETRYFRRFLETLLKVNREFINRANQHFLDKTSIEERKDTTTLTANYNVNDSNNIDALEEAALKNVIQNLKKKKKTTCHFKIRASIRIKDAFFEKGLVRVHIPFPIACKQITNQKLLIAEPEVRYLSEDFAFQKTVYLEERLSENKTFTIEYEYDNTVEFITPDVELVENTIQPNMDHFNDEINTEDLLEQAPHIRFTPYLIALGKEIVGEEENSYRKARRIYDYVTTKIKYTFMREYLTMENIPEYAALNGKGDCGVQSLLFITLCRIAGIPARWQSGLYTTPYSAGSHDWSMFYIAPYGWLFADCSFGGSAYRKGNLEQWDFYFGNLDPFRMPANASFQKEFEPPKKFLRADPYDNQRGEVEYENRGLSYDEFDVIREIIEFYEVDS